MGHFCGGFIAAPQNLIFPLVNQLVRDDPPLYLFAAFRYYEKR